MRKLKIVKILILISLLCFESQAQSNLPSNPCPNIFEYAYVGGKYVGIITLRGIKFGQTTVEVDFTVPGNVDNAQQIPGDLSLYLSQDRIFDYIGSNQPIQFRVSFPTPYTVPRITAIRLNGVTVCSGTKGPSPRTTWNFEYTMTVNSEMNMPHMQSNNGALSDFNNDSPFESPMSRYMEELFEKDRVFQSNPNLPHGFNSVGRPQLSPPFPSTSMHDTNRYNFPHSPYSPSIGNTNNHNFQPLPYPNLPTPSYNGLDMWPTRPNLRENKPETYQSLETVCGQENHPVRDLIVNGRTLDTPKFPWIVAIYKLNVSLLQFQCGGNLISSRTVLSVAHCFKEGTVTIPKERLLFSLGRFKLTDWQNSVNIAAQDIILHPDYGMQGNIFDADIAIVLLKDSASFSHTIRPICLWQDFIDDRAMRGSIVGWGEDGSHTGHVDTLKIVNTTIVSDSKCVRDNPDLFHLTSNRTLCAGYKDGSGPCRGDSGSGLMIREGNKWMLRGLVARSLARGSEDCNLNEFAIFTDVAKFTDWIKQTLLM